jgi:OPA family sugar phosphate sensor protein UhpC-like MFS transporter
MWLLKKFNIFAAPPKREMIADLEKINKDYSYWRIRTFYSMYIGYAFFYLTRKSFTFVMPVMIEELGFTKADLGILGSILYFSYGISKFFSGIVSDRSNPRYFMSIGLIATGICNICFGLSSSILFFGIFWGLNGWFQGWGWPPCARLLTHWYAKNERGRWWGMWNTSHNLGGAFIPLIVGVIASYYGWRMAMYIPGFICIIMGFFLINRLRDTPKSLGLPSIEEYRGGGESEADKIAGKMSKRELLMEVVLRNQYIWILGCAYFFIYVIRTAVNDWGQLYLYEMKGFTLLTAGACIFSFEIGGFLGSLFAGWVSDTIFGGKRGPVNALYSLGLIFSAFGIWFTPINGVMYAHIMMFLSGFLVFGPQMMIGIAAAELSHKNAAGAATGFVGTFAYIGASAAGYPFGKIAEDYGWNTFFVLLCGCALFAFLLLSLVWVPQKEAAVSVR